MKVILLENVVGLGKAGDIKSVKDGYARNYLLPQRMADVATRAKESYLHKIQERLAKKALASLESSRELKEALEKVELLIEVKAGDEGKLFGSVTNADISDALSGKGFTIEKKKVVNQHIKTVGMHTVKIKLDEGVTAEVKLKVQDPNHPDMVASEVKEEVAAERKALAVPSKATTEGFFNEDEDEEEDDFEDEKVEVNTAEEGTEDQE